MKSQMVVPLYGQEPEEVRIFWRELEPYVDLLLVVNDGVIRSPVDYGSATIVYNKENNIYSAWNLGLRRAQASGAHILIISGNDTCVPPVTVKRFEDRAYAYKKAFIGASTLHSYECTDIVGNQCSLEEFKIYAEREASPRFNEQLYFNCFAVSVPWLGQLGGFDERFTVFFGDTDFLMTAAKYGGTRDDFVRDSSCLVYEIWKKGTETIATKEMSVEFISNTFADDAEKFYLKWKDEWDIVENNPFVDVSGFAPNGVFPGKDIFRESQLVNRSSHRLLEYL